MEVAPGNPLEAKQSLLLYDIQSRRQWPSLDSESKGARPFRFPVITPPSHGHRRQPFTTLAAFVRNGDNGTNGTENESSPGRSQLHRHCFVFFCKPARSSQRGSSARVSIARVDFQSGRNEVRGNLEAAAAANQMPKR